MNDDAVIDNDGARGGSKSLIQVMSGKDDRLSGSNGVIEKPVQGLCGIRVKSRVRFIEKNQRGIMKKGPRDADALLNTTRERAHSVVGTALLVHAIENAQKTIVIGRVP